MLNKIKFLDSQNVYIASDFHLGHKRDFIYKPRGYNDYYTHTNDILLTVNNTIATTDILLYIGDFCLNTSIEECYTYLNRINCQTIYMLWGNHNSRVSEIYTQQLKEQYGVADVEIYPLKYKNVIFVGDYLEVTYKHQDYICCHYPIKSWNNISHGSIMCHGHCHGNIKDHLIETDVCGKIIDVSWDVFKKPMKLTEIKAICDKKSLYSPDHHANTD